MIINLKHSASIEQFLAHEMSHFEREAFQKELRSNQGLADEFSLSQTIDKALSFDDIIDLRKKLISSIEAGKSVQETPKVVTMKPRRWWYAAASVIVLMGLAATLYFQTGRSVSNDDLFVQYYSSDNVLDQTRGDENIVEAIIKYQQKDFQSASKLFKRIIEKDNTNMAVWFYYGISNIETNNVNNSIQAFNTIINQKDNLYIEHAEWYLGLCYLKSNLKDKAIDQFVSVASNPDNIHQQEARDILERLQLK
jgi:tetratricopeptide (TPR) repeat protein